MVVRTVKQLPTVHTSPLIGASPLVRLQSYPGNVFYEEGSASLGNMSGNGCPKCDGTGGDEARGAILGPRWSEQTQALLKCTCERNANGETRSQTQAFKRTGACKAVSKYHPCLHCCFLPRSKVQSRLL